MSPDRSSPVDDADIAAGQKRNVNGSLPRKGLLPALTSTPPRSLQSNLSLASLNTNRGHPSDLEFYEDLVSEPVLVLGMDISHLSRREQFIVTAIGVFCFSLLYGYLQELISVELCNRQLGLFLAMVQFTGYTVLAFFLRNFVYHKQRAMSRAVHKDNDDSLGATGPQKQVPFRLYLGLSLLRAVDLAMTNMAMQYLNYPAKTLMKSSRIVFTMFFGVVIQRKKYHLGDYLIVLAMVAGLALFMHADANSDAIFHHMGVIMLTISLICDGAISNMSESIMKDYGVGQDEVRKSIGIPLYNLEIVSQQRLLSFYPVHFSDVLDCLDRYCSCCRISWRSAGRNTLDAPTRNLRTNRPPGGGANLVYFGQDHCYDIVQLNGFFWFIVFCCNHEEFWSVNNVDNEYCSQGNNSFPFLRAFPQRLYI
jgi:drug/metabolite transporter (DMT)-like permease